jgi:urease accessory protein
MRDTDRISRLDELSYVLKGSRELREAAVRLGTQRLRMLRGIDSDPLWKVIEREIESGRMRGTIPVIFGAQIAVGAMPVEAGLTAFYYQAIAGVVSAAMKLFPLGQVAAQTLVTGALGRCGSVVREAASIGEEDIGWFQPLLEIASARHETAYSRIFIS